MATTPYFVLSPTTVVSLLGLLRGADKTDPNPAENWRDAVVDVVIPALNEEEHIALCLSSLARQTFKPRQVILVDDGSNDHTRDYARKYADSIGMELLLIQRAKPIGKTPTIKRQAREFDADVEFILDGDTVLESPNYIERAVEELYKGAGIASACGTILPLRERDRQRFVQAENMRGFMQEHPKVDFVHRHGFWHRLQGGVTNLYREALYLFLQHFVYHGQMVFFGTIINPVGCAVAYRRKYILELFDHYEPILGDDLTNSEDIFIGFALLDQGYRNIQLMDVTARSTEPEVGNLPRQLYFWSSSFLQCTFYFDELMRSPFKAGKRYLQRFRKGHREQQKEIEEKRKIREAYRQPFGIEYSRTYGRPMGWIIFAAALEKIFFPTTMLILLLLRLWEPLLVTVAVETVVSVGILTIIAKGRRFKMLIKGVLLTPVRYTVLLFDFITIMRFAVDLWITKNRRWRK